MALASSRCRRARASAGSLRLSGMAGEVGAVAYMVEKLDMVDGLLSDLVKVCEA